MGAMRHGEKNYIHDFYVNAGKYVWEPNHINQVMHLDFDGMWFIFTIRILSTQAQPIGRRDASPKHRWT